MSTASATITRTLWQRMPFKGVVRPVIRAIRSSRLMPGCWMRMLRVSRIIGFEYGHILSAARMRSIDATGAPKPWITYSATAFLDQLDFSTKRVFEYGCGDSTLYWGRVAAHVDSVEDNEFFCEEVRRRLPGNCKLRFEPDSEEYIHAVALGGAYDVIVIDGHSRVRCAEIAPRYLRPGGMIILDNSDWFNEASAHLRGADLIEVDMAGFAPINDFVTTTSFYLHRAFDFRPKAGKQPIGAVGSRPKPNFPKITRRAQAPVSQGMPAQH